MGCAASSKRQGEQNDVVLVCKERKRLMKLAVQRRYAFADAQCKYNHSLSVVAAAIRLFVARQSSPTMPFLITFPPSSSPSECSTEKVDGNKNNNPMCMQQTPTELISCQPSNPRVSFEIEKKTQEEKGNTQVGAEKNGEKEENEEDDDEEDEVLCKHFYEYQYGWDFFNSFAGSNVPAGVVNKNGGQNVKLAEKEEGISKLEEVEEEDANSENENKNGEVDQGENEISDVKIGEDDKNEKNVSLEESEAAKRDENGKELLEALKEIEEHFLRACESGLEVSKMLEVNKVQLQTGFEEVKESSNKLVRSFTWNRTVSLRSSSCKSIFSSSTKSSSTGTEMKHDLFDEFGGMDSGSHSSTLARLYAWEKKLYQEVKAGEETRKLFEKKCSILRNKDAREDGLYNANKTRLEVKGLHTRIMVTIRSAETISEKIDKLRDEELHLQLVELLHGLMRAWKIKSELHETQNRIMMEVASFNSPCCGKFSNDSHRLATLELNAALQHWQTCFTDYFLMQKLYIEALDGWLSKFISPEVKTQVKNKSQFPGPPHKMNGSVLPPLLVLCHGWLSGFDKLPNIAVTSAMKGLGKDIRALWNQQGEEQQQKRRVDGLSKELGKKAFAFRKVENRVLGTKISEEESEADVRSRIEYLAGRKECLDNFAKRVEMEKEKHISSMAETQRIIVNGFQSGFSSVFESLVGFSEACVKMYGGLVTYIENVKAMEEKNEQ